NRGSSISTSGYRLTPLSFWASTYVATVYIWETGTAMLGSSVAVRGGLYHPRGVSVNAGPSEEHLPVWYTPSDDRSGEDRSGPRAGQTDCGTGDGAHAGRALPALLHRHRGRVDGGGNHGPQRRGVFWRPAFQAQTPEPRRARLPRGHRVLVLRHQYQAVEQGRALRRHRPARDLPRRPPLGPQARPAGGMKKGELKTTGGIEYPAMLIEMAGSTSPRVKGPSWRSRGGRVRRERTPSWRSRGGRVQCVEAPGGIEPPHRSFADCSLSHLGTAPCRDGL